MDTKVEIPLDAKSSSEEDDGFADSSADESVEDDGANLGRDGSGVVESVGGNGDDPEEDPEPPAFFAMYEITLGEVVVEDKDSGREVAQWKAKAEGIEHVSDDPSAAVWGVVERLMDERQPYGVTD